MQGSLFSFSQVSRACKNLTWYLREIGYHNRFGRLVCWYKAAWDLLGRVIPPRDPCNTVTTRFCASRMALVFSLLTHTTV